MLEVVTGQSNQAPAEYVSVGVLSTPFHGAGVDGVKYFSTTNGNSVASNVVTEASGSPISASTLLGYLAEGARTNLCLQSEVLGTTWAPAGADTSVSSNVAVSPGGATTADKIQEATSVSVIHYIEQTITATLAAHTFSCWPKKGERDWAVLQLDGTSNFYRLFNLNTGALGTTTDGVSTSTITAYPNGWYRCTLTGTVTNVTQTARVWVSNSDSIAAYTGTANSGIYAWGAQVELGSFASTYIPTTTASVVRNADVLTYPSAGNASATVGTAYCEASVASILDNESPFSIDDASSNNRVEHRREASATLVVSSGGVNYAVIGVSGLAANTMQKSAVTWNTNYANVALNGVASTADTSVTVPASFTTINIGTANSGTLPIFGTLRNVRIYQTQLSVSQLQAVTA